MGADAWRDFAAWREPQEILRLARVVVVNRPGETIDLESPLRTLALTREASGNDAEGTVEEWKSRVEVATMPAIGLSARDIRARVHAGRASASRSQGRSNA